MENGRPVEYFISRATDPFSESDQRQLAVSALCEKVTQEVDAAQTAVNILAHRVLSPNQDEALYVLRAVETLAQRCGSKIHTKIGKYRFLNQMVKLISHKHNGGVTSPAVRDKAIALLYTWQKQMRHIEKFKEVYDNLREHNVIPSDPDMRDEEIPTIPPPTPKLAPFENEEKAEMLKQLLASNNPEDLQAANRLIKSLVRTEDMKMEKTMRRQEDMERARRACECMEHHLFTTKDYGGIEGEEMKRVFDSLLSIRPTLYKYAGEAAETDEEILADILSLNDQVNRLIQRYQSLPGGKGESDMDKDLLGGELTFEQEIAALASTSSLISDDVAFIGFDSSPIPSSSALTTSPPKEILSDLSSLLDAVPLFNNPSLVSTQGDNGEQQISMETLKLETMPPIEVISTKEVKLFAHHASSSNSQSHTFLLSVLNLFPHNAYEVSFEVVSRQQGTSCRLLPSPTSQLVSFTVGPLSPLQRILVVSGLVFSTEIDVFLTLTDSLGSAKQLSGRLRL